MRLRFSKILPAILLLPLFYGMVQPSAAFERSGQPPERHESARHPQAVSDLAYGASLYQLFLGNRLAAITLLEAAAERGMLQNNPDDADLLLASLYFDYGLLPSAEAIFSRLLNETVSPEVKDRVWFNLAKLQYEQNHLAQAKAYLLKVSNALLPAREAERQYLLTNLYLYEKDFPVASNTVSTMQEDTVWQRYAEYNLGVSLLEQGEVSAGQNWLEKLTGASADDIEVLSLRDAAYLATGLAMMKQNKADAAIRQFAAIRLDSPVSNRALLATGWAWSRSKQPEKARVYWNQLLAKQQDDDASMEVPVASAYLYEQLGDKVRAAQEYQKAITGYRQQLEKLDALVESVDSMVLLDVLFAGSGPATTASYVSGTDDTFPPFMQQVLADAEFQQALQDYRELLEIRDSLVQWQENLPVLTLVLNERRQAFESRKPVIVANADIKQLQIMQQQRHALAAEVMRIKTKQDVMALATEDENDHLQQLEALALLFEKLESHFDLSEEKEKYRLLKGMLVWTLTTEFPRRYWQLYSQLQALDRSLLAAETSAKSLQQAAVSNGHKLDDLAQRINGREQAIQSQLQTVNGLVAQQTQHINHLLTGSIETRRAKLENLRFTARHSLARVYDELLQQQEAR